MNTIHEHSLLVRLGQETGKPEIYCLDPQCCYSALYDSNLLTHRTVFGKDVAALMSREEK